MFLQCLAYKFYVKWIVRESDIQNRFLEKCTPSSTRENHHKRLQFLN